MGSSSTPALVPVLCLLIGVWFGTEHEIVGAAGRVGVPLVVLLAVVGWAWRRLLGRLLSWTALGVLVVWIQPEAGETCLERLDHSRPVTLLGEQKSVWRAAEFGWKASLAVRLARQGATVVRCSATVPVSLAGDSPPLDGSSARSRGFLRRYEPLRNGTDRHPHDARGRWRMHLKSSRFWEASAAEGTVARSTRLARGLRAGVSESFTGVERRPGVRAARALILGEREALEPSFHRTLRRFGLSHLFAVSGLHVALIAVLVRRLLGSVNHRPRMVVVSLVVILYLVLVGARPSIVRATAMSLLAFGAFGVERPHNSRQALCLVAGALVVFEPALISSVGYQLTVSATAGILWLSPALEKRWSRLPRLPRRSLAATIGAQLGSLPWAVSAFSLVHPLAPLLNLIAIPWVAGFTLCSLLASAVMKLFPAARGWAAAVLDVGVGPVSWLSNLPASRWFTLPVAVGFGEACALTAGLAALLLSKSRTSRWLALASILILLRGPSLSDVGELVALDVGQGDAMLIHDGELAVLFDGGGWRRGDIAASVLTPALARLGVRRLAGIVMTHPDVDHCRGLVDLVNYVPVGRIWIAPGATRSPCGRELVTRFGIPWRQLWRGETLRVGRMTFEVLHPDAGSTSLGNDSSLVVRVALGNRSVLLTGDVEASSERKLLALRPLGRLHSDILKLAHHGSKTSTSEEFLAAVSPRMAVVSAGSRNRYGHPSEEVLARCRRHRVSVTRTDRDGMIRLPLEPHRRRSAWLKLWPDE